MAIKFYKKRYQNNWVSRLHNNISNKSPAVYNKEFIEWMDQLSGPVYFESIHLDGDVVVRVLAKELTHSVYGNTSIKHDALVFANESDALLFKLTWL